MQHYTIVNSFRDSGMWPLSCKAGLKKMRAYGKKKAAEEGEQEELELPALPPTRPAEVWDTAAKVQALGDRDPTQFSEPSKELFFSTIKAVGVQLQKSHLLSIEHGTLQEKLRAEEKRKVTSRRSLHKGGGAPTVNELRAIRKERDEKEHSEKLRKAKKKLFQAISRAKKDLGAKGVQARKDERARL